MVCINYTAVDRLLSETSEPWPLKRIGRLLSVFLCVYLAARARVCVCVCVCVCMCVQLDLFLASLWAVACFDR